MVHLKETGSLIILILQLNDLYGKSILAPAYEQRALWVVTPSF